MSHTPSFYLFTPTAPSDIYTLSLHDALPILMNQLADDVQQQVSVNASPQVTTRDGAIESGDLRRRDRKSTRLNSSHVAISYAVFCLKKKNNVHVKSDSVYMLDNCVNVLLVLR